MSSKYLDENRQARLAGFEYEFDKGLGGRLVLVSGGSGGLGAAITARLMSLGADVVVGYRTDEARATRLKEALEARHGRPLRLVGADITTDEGLRTCIEAVSRPEFYGAVICVGDPARIPSGELGVEQIQGALRSNYSGPALLARACAQELSARRTPGAVVLLSSMQGVEPFAGSLAYAGPKSALVHAARILAQEHGGAANVRVNIVAPGVTVTGMALASIRTGKYDPYVEEGVIPRFGFPEDVARAVAFFMVPDNYVTGQVLSVDGGLMLRRGVR